MVVFSTDFLPSSTSSTAILSAAATITTTIVLLGSINDLIPDPFQNYFCSRLRRFSNRLSSQLTVVIQEFDGLTSNHIFEAANVYLGTKISPLTQRIRVSKPEKDHELAITADKNQEIVDSFHRVQFKWVLQCAPIKQTAKGDMGNPRTEHRFFELSFHKKHKDMVLKTYLPYILQKAKDIKEESKVVRRGLQWDRLLEFSGTEPSRNF